MTKEVRGVLKEVRREETKRDAERAQMRADRERESEIGELQAQGWLLTLKPASVSLYERWLAGYILGGGRPTHVYDYSFPKGHPDFLKDMGRGRFFVATEDIKIMGDLCGSMAVQVIVPKGIRVEIEEAGHCNVYWMDGFITNGSWIPIYSDIQ